MCSSDDQSSGCQTHFLFNCQWSKPSKIRLLFLEDIYSFEYIYIIYSIEYIVKRLLQNILKFFEELKMGFPERLKELRLKKGKNLVAWE